jgi:tetratricopeptide (TPR) repeat protein
VKQPVRLLRKLKRGKGPFGALFLCALLSGSLSACNANSPETKFVLAEKLLEDRKYDAAITEFQAIVDKSPNSNMGLQAQLKVAEIQHLYLGHAPQAIEAYQEFLKRNKDENKRREVEKTMADLQFQSFEDYDQAIASYSKLVKENSERKEGEELMFRLGRSFFMKSKFEDAIKMFQYQKERFPSGFFFWKAELEIGNSLSAKGACGEAIKQFDKVIAGAPKDLQVLASFGKAACFEEQDDLDQAYELFSAIRDDYPAPTVVELKMQKIKRRKILRKR